MDSSVSDEGKLFVGGIAWDTKDGALRDYFNRYGEVTHAVIMKDKATGQPRGFGFVVFSDPGILDSILAEKHTIDGRLVEVKRALSREKQQSSGYRDSNAANGSNNPVRQDNFRTKKIFVGGLPSTLTKVEFTQYFLSYGEITDAVIMFDQATGRSRGFGFITFDTEDAVDRVLSKNFHELSNKLVEVKRALPKEVSPGFGIRGRTSNAYGSYSANTNGFDTQMESRGYFQLQPPIGSYPSYSAFGALGYGYGMANNGAIYSGLGAYAFGNYGTATANHDIPAVAFGDQTASSTGYFSGGAGFLRTHWGSQAQGYGALAYGPNANFGVTVPWSTPSVNAPSGRSPRDTPLAGNTSCRGSEGSYTDSGRSRTVNRNKRNSTKSNAGQNADEVGHHQAGGEDTKGRTYNSSNDS